MSLPLGIALLLMCVATEAFFSGSEIAMVHADRIRLQAQADDGDVGAGRALKLLSDESSLLGTCLIGTNLSTVTGATLAALLLLEFGITDGWTVTGVFAPMTLLFGEALPKTVMQHHAERVVPVVAGPLLFFRAVFRPFLAVVRAWNGLLTRVVGGSGSAGYLSRQELLDLLETHRQSPIDPEERRLIRGVLSLSEITVEEAMTPLVQVVAVHLDATVGVAADIAVRTHHSRLPVYSKRIDNIVGMVHQADLLFLPDDGAPLADHVRQVRFVPDSKRADELFAEMRAEGEHFAVVVDEYGGCVGIVTLEDLLEELVGDIEDERDLVRPRLLALEDGTWSVPGDAAIDEVERRLGIDLPDGDYETIAGLVLFHLGHIPTSGETVELDPIRLRVEEATDRAVKRLHLERIPAPEAGTADA
ncbi:MAG: HlyC/CorC family transporter [Alphaproteobacteria bacterium]|nr:HlyC/CorC family transporter [Alphaproteobacteria bacterium]